MFLPDVTNIRSPTIFAPVVSPTSCLIEPRYSTLSDITASGRVAAEAGAHAHTSASTASRAARESGRRDIVMRVPTQPAGQTCDVRIRRLGPGDEAAVLAAPGLFDAPPTMEATRRFLAQDNHHLLLAEEDGAAVGFVSGVETTHPDKGTEMFLYELSVDGPARRRGIGAALVEALASVARERGCYGMWVGTEPGNEAARRTYARAGGRETPTHVIVEWELGSP